MDELMEEKLDQMKSSAQWLVDNGMPREQVETEFYIALGDEVNENEPEHVGGGPKS